MTGPTQTTDQPPGVIPEVDYAALQPGQTIGRYEIVSVLGQGGFGITYRARDVQLGREVAIKEYLPSALAIRQDGATVLPRTTKMADDFGWGRDRFVTEGRTLASLHRATAIVHVFDYLEANGTAYIVMELLSGETLEERITKNGKLSSEEVDRILWPLLDGLEQVHSAGFLHRDIKPANILLDAAGNPTLIDFGASRAAMAGPQHGAHRHLHAGLCRGRADDLGQAGPVDRHLRPVGDALSRHHRQDAARRLRPHAERHLRAAVADQAGRLLAGRAGRHRRGPCRRGQRPAAEHRRLAADPRHDRGAGGRCHGRHRQGAGAGTAARLDPAAALRRSSASSRTGLWLALVAVVLALLGGGGYYYAVRGPDPETVKAQRAAEEAEAGRLKAEEVAAKLRIENEQRLKAEEERVKAAQIAAARERQEAAEAAAKKQFEEETRRKIEAEMASQKKAEEEAKRKADEEAEARRKAVEDARKAVEFVAGAFDHFGKSLMMIGLKDRSGRDPPAGRRHRGRPGPARGRGRGAGRPAARPALPADRPADRRHAALSLPDHAAQRQAAVGRRSRFRPRRPCPGAGQERPGAGLVRCTAFLRRR